jgi:hypothetical protein
MMPDQYFGKTEFEPALLTGQSARLHVNATEFHDVRVVSWGYLPSHLHDFGSLTGGTASLANDCSHIDMPDGELAQYRFRINDPAVEIELKHPASTQQWTVQSSSTTAGTNWRMRYWSEQDPTDIQKWMFKSSEFFVFEQNTPRFDLYPLDGLEGARTSQGYVEFFGFRYALERLPNGERGMVDMWVQGWPGGSI